MKDPKVSRCARCAALMFVSVVLMGGCGGGGGGDQTAVVKPPMLALMVDSFGQAVVEADFGGGDSGASGADGTAGEGAGIANATVRVLDSIGRAVSVQSDSRGYYRARIDGFIPPFVVSVTTATGRALYSPATAATKARGFVTINITGLTDKLASDVALAAGRRGPSELTPAIIAANPAALQAAKANLNAQLSLQIAAAGLNAATFDPVTFPFRPDMNGYDKVLESVSVGRDSSGATVITPKVGLGGTISGLGARSGLSLKNGLETIAIPSNSTTFAFPSLVAQGASYAVTVSTQPSGATCAITNSAGTAGATAISNIAVACGPVSGISGIITGLTGDGFQIQATNKDRLSVPAAATSFTFPLTAGSLFSLLGNPSPYGQICNFSPQTGIVGDPNLGPIAVNCIRGFYVSFVPTARNGLVIRYGSRVIPIGETTVSITSPSNEQSTLTIEQQPTTGSCSVSPLSRGPGDIAFQVNCSP